MLQGFREGVKIYKQCRRRVKDDGFKHDQRIRTVLFTRNLSLNTKVPRSPTFRF